MAQNKLQKYLGRGVEKAEGEAGKEKVIAEVTGVDTAPDRLTVILEVNAMLSTEAEAEESILRIRRNGVTGPEVAKLAEAIAASTKSGISFTVADKPGEVAGMTYVLTSEQKKATKKDTFIFPTLQATV